MNFLQIKQRIARRTGKNSSSLDSATNTRLGDFVNERHRELLRMPGMESLRWATFQFSSAASTAGYSLPAHAIARINRIWETTNDRKLTYKTMDWLRTVDPDLSSGTPCYWIPAGFTETASHPSDASSLFVKSTSASDINTVYVEGIRSGGYYHSASVVMTGVTAVAISSTIADWVRVTKVYLSAAAAGTVTLHEDSGVGTELARIAIGDVRAQYYHIILYPVPSAVVTYTCDILRAIPDMSNDTDEPLLPEDFHDLLITGGRLSEYEKGDDGERLRIAEEEWAVGKRQLQSFVTSHPDWIPNWNGYQVEHSSLGAWFPSGS
jgi:hypothetical protein